MTRSAIALALLVPAAASAQSAAVHAPAPVVQAVRIAGDAPHVDGRIEEAAWAAAQVITEFRQLDPEEGQPVSERTEVRVLFDDQALYVAARLFDRGEVRTRLGRRDMGRGDSDWFAVILDSYHDHRSAYVFLVNPSGVKRDAVRLDQSADATWDAVWEADASIDAEGWTAEIRIPFSQLRFNPGEAPVWGIQFERDIQRRGEYAMFAFTPKAELQGAAKYGHLVGLDDIRPSGDLELLPYTVARTERVDPGPNPFREPVENDVSAGLDLLWRATSDFTLNATVNPDFGQVEVDPAVVNLTAFETFFEERRPFFVEGANAFAFGSATVGPGSQYTNLFYSRRVGRAPQLGAPTLEADVPATTTILGAAKLTGRSASGWSVGLMQALTGREETKYRLADGSEDVALAEPRTHYGVARLSHQSPDGARLVGAVLTGTHRDLEDPRAAAYLRSGAWSGGIDFSQEWDRRAWRLSGFVAGSHVRGDSSALLLTQRSPARYFQRVDSDGLEVDPGRTSLSGMAGQVQVLRQAGTHWRGDAGGFFVTPGYEINDLGFQTRADLVGGNGRILYVENTPGSLFRNYSFAATYVRSHNFDGDNVANSASASAGALTSGFWGLRTSVTHGFEREDDRLTRGGPVTRFPSEWTGDVTINSDSRRPFTVNSYARASTWATGGWQTMAQVSFDYRPSGKWAVSIAPRLERGFGTAQYLAAVADPAIAAGRRWVFADIERTTLAAETRLNITFSPTTSLELYAQPFISTGDLHEPKELVDPKSLGWAVYGRDQGTLTSVDGGSQIDPDGDGPAASFYIPDLDFNLRSLRGNAVFRWEWRPGSTLYVAWQQSRAARLPFGDFAFRRDTGSLFDAPPDNVVVFKMNYWLAL